MFIDRPDKSCSMSDLTIDDVKNWMQTASYEDLSGLVSTYNICMKNARNLQGQLNRMALSVGDRVWLAHSKRGAIEVVIEDLRRTKATVREDCGQGWTCPIASLSPME